MMKRMIWESLILVILTAAVAFGSNHIRPDGLPLLGMSERPPAKIKQMAPAIRHLNTEQAQEALNDAQVLFVDGRSRIDFDEEHIPGAINLPLYKVLENPELINTLPTDKRIVTYCSDDLCKKAERLAKLLYMKGYKTEVYPGGINAWMAAGLDIERGK